LKRVADIYSTYFWRHTPGLDEYPKAFLPYQNQGFISRVATQVLEKLLSLFAIFFIFPQQISRIHF